jgi:hypothetical protein
MFHTPNILKVNPHAEIYIADGLRCPSPSCNTIIRAVDAEMLTPRGLRIVSRVCHRQRKLSPPKTPRDRVGRDERRDTVLILQPPAPPPRLGGALSKLLP